MKPIDLKVTGTLMVLAFVFLVALIGSALYSKTGNVLGWAVYGFIGSVFSLMAWKMIVLIKGIE